MELETLKLIIEIAGAVAVAIYYFRKKNLEEGAKALASVFDEAVALAEGRKNEDGNAKTVFAIKQVSEALEKPVVKKMARKLKINLDEKKIKKALGIAHQARKSGIKQVLKRNFLAKLF